MCGLTLDGSHLPFRDNSSIQDLQICNVLRSDGRWKGSSHGTEAMPGAHAVQLFHFLKHGVVSFPCDGPLVKKTEGWHCFSHQICCVTAEIFSMRLVNIWKEAHSYMPCTKFMFFSSKKLFTAEEVKIMTLNQFIIIICLTKKKVSLGNETWRFW